MDVGERYRVKVLDQMNLLHEVLEFTREELVTEMPVLRDDWLDQGFYIEISKITPDLED